MSGAHIVVEITRIVPLPTTDHLTLTRVKLRRQRAENAAIVVSREDTMPNPKIEPLKRVLAMEPDDDVAWFGLGKAYMEDANFEEAAKALRQCITVKPTYSAAYYALAQSLLKLNRVDECRQVSDQGIDVSTKNGDAMVTKNLEALKSSLPA
ncbi:MAG: tetratricopeptide repeat protein [Nitrospira sp. NTP1]|nr:tetratricopeptide repeat protein [Nitrospira sp. NTP1]